MMLSVIIAVYNTCEYLEQCIDSVLCQTFSDYEILIVDDGSGQDCREKIDLFCARDKRIQIIRHSCNRGLFAARVTGMKEAKGDYIAFLDSDDFVSLDYYRIMIKAAVENPDIVIGQTVESEGFLHVKNLHDAAFSFEKLEGEELQRQFWGQEGNCFAWHTVWNKIYSRRLLSSCLPWFETVTEHLVMTEDIAFSSVLFLFAEKVCFVHSGAYFYIHRKGSSTDAEKITLKKYAECIHDLGVSFRFVQNVLRKTNQPEWKLRCFERFRVLYARRWKNVQNAMISKEDRKEAQKLLAAFYDPVPDLKRDDYFYHECMTVWDNRMEVLKDKVVNGPYRYISFDIFDTVLVRPFSRPQDLYRLMNGFFHTLYPSGTDFYDIRIHGETGCRQESAGKHPQWQDVSITEIYDYICRNYALPEELCQKLLDFERKLEYRYSGCRQAVKEVYDLALAAGKKVVFISDMYLDEMTVLGLLDKAGCHGFERLFLSSKERKVKWTGDLFRFALEELRVQPSEILHIGDNWDTDIKIARQIGMHVYHVPRTMELFDTYCMKPLKYICGNVLSKNISGKSIGCGCMQAMAANRYFDHPFRPFHQDTDYNMDPYLIGYHAVGMHLAGLVRWIAGIVQKNQYQRIVFTSRDGYMPMKAYEKYRSYHMYLPEAVYLHMSRRSLLPLMLKEKADFYELPLIVEYHSPKSWMELLSFCRRDDFRNIIEADHIDIEQNFSNIERYHWFVTYFLKYLYSEKKHKEKILKIQEYFKILQPDDVIFDMGYSGRLQDALCDAVGNRLDAMYIYGRQELDQRKANSRYHYEVYRLYELQPDAPDFFREYLLSEPGPSCVDYVMESGNLKPVFDDVSIQANELFVVRTIQRAAMEFLEDFYGKFLENEDAIFFSPQEASLPFEGFLRFASRQDRHIFSACYGEDQVYSARASFNMEDFLAGQYQERKSVQDVLLELEGMPEGMLGLLKGRKVALFGTGRMLERLHVQYPEMNAAFCLDNDPKKSGEFRHGKIVLHPSSVKDWSQLFIIITSVYTDEISAQLEGFGLRRGHDYISFRELERTCIRRD